MKQILVTGDVKFRAKVRFKEPLLIVDRSQIRDPDEKIGDTRGFRFEVTIPEIDAVFNACDVTFDGNPQYEGPPQFEELVLEAFRFWNED